jgi:hypothetical protein
MKEEDLLLVDNDQPDKQRQIFKKAFNKALGDYFGFFIAGVVILIFVFSFFFLLKPKYEQTNQLVGIINKQEAADFENKKVELQKILNLLSAYKAIDDNYKKKVYSIIPARENKEEIFSEINYLVSRNGLFLQSVNLSEGGAYDISDDLDFGGKDYLSSGEIKKVTISFGVRGTDYEVFKNFLSAVENSLPIFDVVSLSFDPSNKVSSFLIDTYYIPVSKKN